MQVIIHRPGDIERFAELGIKKLRYPVLWEHHQPERNKEIDWTWTEKQLEQFAGNNIIPIAGLFIMEVDLHLQILLITDFPDKLAVIC